MMNGIVLRGGPDRVLGWHCICTCACTRIATARSGSWRSGRRTVDGASASASKPQKVYTPSWGTSDLPVASSLGFIGRKGWWLFSAPMLAYCFCRGDVESKRPPERAGWLLRGSRGSMQRSDPARWVSDLASSLEFRRVTATTTRRRPRTAALLFCLWPSIHGLVLLLGGWMAGRRGGGGKPPHKPQTVRNAVVEPRH